MENVNNSKLGTEKIGKLIFSMGLPAVLAQLINVLYNIVDRMYIGHISQVGDLALTGVGVTFPIIMIISAFSAFVGYGGAPLASIKLGEEDKDSAEKILGNGLTILIFFSIVLTILFMVFKEPLLYTFGASDKTIGFANDYITIYLLGTIFVQIALGLNTFISAQGFAKTAMFSVLIGAIINIILDPIFIFGLNLGVKGAALATIISQAVSAMWVLRFLLSSKSLLRIKKKNLRINKKIALSIAALGISPFIMQSTESLIGIVFNSGLQKYGGDLYVGSMTILLSVMQLLVVPIQGFTQGIQPIISYNYGAKNYDRVKKTFKILIVVTFATSTLAFIIMCTFPEIFVAMFTQKEELAQLSAKMMPIYMGGMWAFGLQMGCQATFMGLGQAKISLFLALLRKVILLIPLAIILPLFFKVSVNGIYFAEPIADIIASFTTLTIFIISFKKILGESKNTEPCNISKNI